MCTCSSWTRSSETGSRKPCTDQLTRSWMLARRWQKPPPCAAGSRWSVRPCNAGPALYALSSALARRQRALAGLVAEKLPGLEQEVMRSSLTAPEVLLERMFLIRHELITARTMAAQTHDVYARIGSLDRFVPEPSRLLARDLADQFNRVRSIADGEAQFLFGVIELYQTKVNTKMTLAMERLAVIAAVTLPITARRLCTA